MLSVMSNSVLIAFGQHWLGGRFDSVAKALNYVVRSACSP